MATEGDVIDQRDAKPGKEGKAQAKIPGFVGQVPCLGDALGGVGKKLRSTVCGLKDWCQRMNF